MTFCERLARLRPEGVEELVEVDGEVVLLAARASPRRRARRVVGPRGDRDVAVGDPRERGGADDGRRALVERLVDRDRDLGLRVVGQGDAVDRADRLAGDEHLVAGDELAAVLEEQVVGAPAEPPPKRTTSTSTRPTRRAPPAAARAIHVRRPAFTRLIVQAPPVGAACPLLLSSIREPPARPGGNVLSFPGRAACPGTNASLLAASYFAPHRSRPTLCLQRGITRARRIPGTVAIRGDRAR